MDWSSKDNNSNKQREQNLQDAAPAHEGDATANEGANAQANAISAAGDNQQVNQDDEATPVLTLDPMINLSTIGLWRSERMRKLAKRMHMTAMMKESAHFLTRYVDQQQQQQ